jgi:hypothetical protein
MTSELVNEQEFTAALVMNNEAKIYWKDKVLGYISKRLQKQSPESAKIEYHIINNWVLGIHDRKWNFIDRSKDI